MNNNLNLNINTSVSNNLPSTAAQSCSTNTLQAHQMPRKAYFLNKYEQLNVTKKNLKYFQKKNFFIFILLLNRARS